MLRAHLPRAAAAAALLGLATAALPPRRDPPVDGRPPPRATEDPLTAGERRFRAGDRTAARAAYEQALALAESRGDGAAVAAALHGLGGVLEATGDYGAARACYERSLGLAERLGSRALVASAHADLGIVDYREGEPERAQAHLERGAALARAAGDRAVLAKAVTGLGNVAYFTGELDHALARYAESLALRRALGDLSGIALVLNNQGSVHYARGDYTAARALYRRGLAVAKRSGDPSQIARALNSFGSLHYMQNEYAQALGYLTRALAIQERLGDRAEVARALNNLAVIHDVQGNGDQALALYGKALALQRRLADRPGMARLLNNIGEVHLGRGELDAAERHFRQALALARAMGDKEVIAGQMHSLGTVHAALGRLGAAREAFAAGLELGEELADRVGVARHTHELAAVDLRLGDAQQARRRAGRAATLAGDVGELEIYWRARTTEGQALRALGASAEAQAALDEAIATLETLRGRVAGGEMERQRFLATRLAPYHELFRLALAAGRPEAALAAAERARGRVLLDVLRSGRGDVDAALTPEERGAEERLLAELRAANRALYAARQASGAGAARRGALERAVREARLEYESYRAAVFSRHVRLRERRGEVSGFELGTTAARLVEPGTALVEYVVLDEASYAFALTAPPGGGAGPPRLAWARLAAGRRELERRVADLERRLAARQADFRVAAAELYALLLQPLETHLTGAARLTIVPDGVLWELPFQALVAGDGRYLLERHAVSYAISFAVLDELRARAHTLRRPARRLLALGNPEVGGVAPARLRGRLAHLRGRLRGRSGDLPFGRLPEAEAEVRDIARLYGAAGSRVYVGAAAQEARVKREAGSARVLHVAAHAVLDDRDPLYSHVVLAQSGGGAVEDGLLEAWEILDLRLGSDLAVLSACQTARGRHAAGEGVIGMSWALFVAGTPATLVSLWAVDSASTRELMVAFHRELVAGRPKAEALRRAALALLRDGRHHHPFYWAPFVLVGDGS